VLSGSVGVNEAIMQLGQHDLPLEALAQAAWGTTMATKAF
jgi:hypothetical protein